MKKIFTFSIFVLLFFCVGNMEVYGQGFFEGGELNEVEVTAPRRRSPTPTPIPNPPFIPFLNLNPSPSNSGDLGNSGGWGGNNGGNGGCTGCKTLELEIIGKIKLPKFPVVVKETRTKAGVKKVIIEPISNFIQKKGVDLKGLVKEYNTNLSIPSKIPAKSSTILSEVKATVSVSNRESLSPATISFLQWLQSTISLSYLSHRIQIKEYDTQVSFAGCSNDNKCISGIDLDCNTSKADLKSTFGGKDEVLNGVVDAINKHAAKFGIDTEIEINHFLAQAAHESRSFKTTTEDTYYRPWVLMDKFGDFFNDDISDVGNKNKDSNKKNLSDFGTFKNSKGITFIKEKEALFNHIYNDAERKKIPGSSLIGNTQPGDGWKYRGRGIIQITGKENYTKFSNWYKDNVDAKSDILNNPDLVNTNKEIGTLASLWYFKNKVIKPLGGINAKTTVEAVTVRVNSAKDELKKREANFDNAQKKIECK